MLRYVLAAAAAVALAAVLVVPGQAAGQQPGPMGPMGPMGPGAARGMGGWTPPASIAAAGGSIFLLQGNTLKKLDADLNEVKSATVQVSPEAGQAMGRMMQQGGGPGGPGAMMGMMVRGSVAADANAVYVFAGGTLTVYDHNLNQLKSKDLSPPAAPQAPPAPE